jgi:hypothetical protein
VFRSYVVAVQIADRSDKLCDRLDQLPLLDAERVATPLSDYHPSELFLTVAIYNDVTKAPRHTMSSVSSSMSGGVTIAARQFSAASVREGRTPLTQLITARATGAKPSAETGDPATRLVSLTLDGPLSASVTLASNSASSDGGNVIRNEPPAQPFPTPLSDDLTQNKPLLIVLSIIFLIFLAAFHTRRRARR